MHDAAILTRVSSTSGSYLLFWSDLMSLVYSNQKLLLLRAHAQGVKSLSSSYTKIAKSRGLGVLVSGQCCQDVRKLWQKSDESLYLSA